MSVQSPPAPHRAQPLRQRATRTRLVLAAMLLAVLTLSGCYKADVKVTVNGNDTLSGTIFIGVGPTAGSEALDTLDPGTIMTIVPGAVVTDHKDPSGYRGRSIKFTDVPLDSLANPALKELVGVEIKVSRIGEQFSLRGTFDGTKTKSVAAGTQDATQINASFTFPGPVGETNGTVAKDGRTVSWAPAGGEQIEMRAVASAKPANQMLMYVGIGTGSVAVVLVAFALWRRFAPAPKSAAAEAPAVSAQMKSKKQPKVKTRAVKTSRKPVETHDAAPARQIVAPPANWWDVVEPTSDPGPSDGNQTPLAHGETGQHIPASPASERNHP